MAHKAYTKALFQLSDQQWEVHEAVQPRPLDQLAVAQLLGLNAQVIVLAPLDVELSVMTREVDTPVPAGGYAQVELQAFRPQSVALKEPMLGRFVAQVDGADAVCHLGDFEPGEPFSNFGLGWMIEHAWPLPESALDSTQV